MKFIYHHTLSCDSHTSFIGVAVLGSHWEKTSAENMVSSYKTINQTILFFLRDPSLIALYKTKLVGCVLWHINPCRLFNAKSSFYIRGSLNKFPDFFRMDTFIDSTHMKL